MCIHRQTSPKGVSAMNWPGRLAGISEGALEFLGHFRLKILVTYSTCSSWCGVNSEIGIRSHLRPHLKSLNEIFRKCGYDIN